MLFIDMFGEGSGWLVVFVLLLFCNPIFLVTEYVK